MLGTGWNGTTAPDAVVAGTAASAARTILLAGAGALAHRRAMPAGGGGSWIRAASFREPPARAACIARSGAERAHARARDRLRVDARHPRALRQIALARDGSELVPALPALRVHDTSVRALRRLRRHRMALPAASRTVGC